MAEVTIKVRRSGPYVVMGAVKLVDHAGNPFPLGDQEAIALCRCGHSETRPFCDGHHKTCGFVSEETAAAGS